MYPIVKRLLINNIYIERERERVKLVITNFSAQMQKESETTTLHPAAAINNGMESLVLFLSSYQKLKNFSSSS